MIYDAVLHPDMFTASLPAAAVFDTGVWRPWVSGEVVGGLLYNIADTGLGTIGESGDVIPDISESVMEYEFEFAPEDIGEYPFTATPDLLFGETVGNADLEITAEGLWNDRIVQAVPSELDFKQIGSVEDTVKTVELSSLHRKTVLNYPSGIIDSPAFELEPVTFSRILQPAIAPVHGKQYYLHPDGSITTNPNGALAPIAYGYSGGWKIGTAP